MESSESKAAPAENRPACFGDEIKFIAYLENTGADCECAHCPSENDCGEFILLKCSRELIF
jgi:hypothetical protein